MRRRELRREAFLGEMVVGHKNAESYKTPFIFIYFFFSHERIMRTFAKIAEIQWKHVCKVCKK